MTYQHSLAVPPSTRRNVPEAIGERVHELHPRSSRRRPAKDCAIPPTRESHPSDNPSKQRPLKSLQKAVSTVVKNTWRKMREVKERLGGATNGVADAPSDDPTASESALTPDPAVRPETLAQLHVRVDTAWANNWEAALANPNLTKNLTEASVSIAQAFGIAEGEIEELFLSATAHRMPFDKGNSMRPRKKI